MIYLCVCIFLSIQVFLSDIGHCQSVTASDCNDTLPSDWTESYCPSDLTRIEYQIGSNEDILERDGEVNATDEYLDWIVTNLQNDIFSGYFRLRTTKIKKYYRTVDQLTVSQPSPGIPRSSRLKYRRSFGNFQTNNTIFGESDIKYQNDLTWEITMTTNGKDINYEEINSTTAYYAIYTTKLEANVFVNTCRSDYLTDYFSIINYTYGIKSTGFSGKVEFDESDDYGSNDTNGMTMINVTHWDDTDEDTFIGTYNGDTINCTSICCDGEEYFKDYCSYYVANDTSQSYSLSNKVDYIVDIDFYWYKNGDYLTICADNDNCDDGDDYETSKGKLTFQTRFKDWGTDEVSVTASSELSVKLYKSKTVNGEWDNLITFTELLIDSLTDQSNGATEWIRYDGCEINDTTSNDDGDDGDDSVGMVCGKWIYILALFFSIVVLFV